MKRNSFWKAAIVLGLCLPLQSYRQNEQNDGFNQKVLGSSFTEADKNVWPIKNNQFAFYFIKDKRYLLQGRTAAHWEILLPRDETKLMNFRVESTLLLQKDKNADGAVGLAVGVNQDQSSGYIIEIGQDRHF